MNDGYTRKGYNKHFYIAMAVVLALVGFIVAQGWNSADARPATPQERAIIADIVTQTDAFSAHVRNVLSPAEKRSCRPVYDYPGCTAAQAASLEAPNGPQIRQNYDKKRWSQQGVQSQWSNLTNASNDKMRRLYDNAVNRFESKMRKSGFTGKAAHADYQTWVGFRNAMECGGSFGAWTGLVSAWCRTQQPINWVVDNLDHVALDCSSFTLKGFFIGAAGSALKLIATTVKVASWEGAALAAVACTVDEIGNQLTAMFHKRKMSRGDELRARGAF